jgi:hypothetical protein
LGRFEANAAKSSIWWPVRFLSKEGTLRPRGLDQQRSRRSIGLRRVVLRVARIVFVALSVWHCPHPAERKTRFPASAFPELSPSEIAR